LPRSGPTNDSFSHTGTRRPRGDIQRHHGAPARPAWLRDSRARQQAQADAANEQASLARQQAQQISLERRRDLSGWSGHGINTYPVELVTGKDELRQAADEIASGKPTDYATLRVRGGADGGDSAHLIRDLVEREGTISRPPTIGERQALETGLGRMACL
jgi:hypothetical protein